ncbi:MAG: hypothetical protein ACO1RX_20065 [Candidatus Sericytochromatia bacterium]
MSTLITIIQEPIEKYTVLDLTAEEDANLSWGAKGIHTYLISRPPGWEVYANDLINRSQDGRDSVRALVRELRQAGYLHIVNTRNAQGRFDRASWHVFRRAREADPALKQNSPKKAPPPAVSPETENPAAVTPAPAKPPLNSNQGISNQGKQKTKTTTYRAASKVLSQEADNPPSSPRDKEVEELIPQLTELGIDALVAESLIIKHTPAAVRQQLAWLPARNPRNRAAVLQRALRDEWGAPTGPNQGSDTPTLAEQVEDIRERAAARLVAAVDKGLKSVTWHGQRYEVLKLFKPMRVLFLKTPEGKEWKAPVWNIAHEMEWEEIA